MPTKNDRENEKKAIAALTRKPMSREDAIEALATLLRVGRVSAPTSGVGMGQKK